MIGLCSFNSRGVGLYRKAGNDILMRRALFVGSYLTPWPVAEELNE